MSPLCPKNGSSWLGAEKTIGWCRFWEFLGYPQLFEFLQFQISVHGALLWGGATNHGRRSTSLPHLILLQSPGEMGQ